MNSRFFQILFFLFNYGFTAFGQNIEIAEAEKIFIEYKEICQKDNGNLWGLSLHGPLMFVEKESRTIIANTADKQGALKKINGVYHGILPDRQGIANTTTNWNGLQWTMVIWPLNDERYERTQLIFHETFHRLQVKLGINLPNAENPHLDTKEGRILLQLEWLALLRALNASLNLEAIQDALLFRNYRRSLFHNSDSTENALELLEGIPEYTGIKLSGRDSVEIWEYLTSMVQMARDRESYFRTFPYTSGPLYCFLIEQKDSKWRKYLLEIDDLGVYLKNCYFIDIPVNLKTEVEIRSKKYGIDKIIELENIKEKELKERKDKIIATFFHSTIFVLPIIKPNIEFSPLNMMAIDNKGTYYKTLRIVDVWGILDVKEGAFITQDWSKIYVPANNIKKDDTKISGKDWNLTLTQGWELSTNTEKGIYTLYENK